MCPLTSLREDTFFTKAQGAVGENTLRQKKSSQTRNPARVNRVTRSLAMSNASFHPFLILQKTHLRVCLNVPEKRRYFTLCSSLR